MEARVLIRAGKYTEACPKLELSFALDPALGTLLNLSDCYEHIGRTASAWLRYREAAAMAVQQGHREREAIARERSAALEKRLCRITIRATQRPNLEIARDGTAVRPEALGLPTPVDPGPHIVTARAPGATFAKQLEIVVPDGDGPCPIAVVDIPTPLDGETTLPAQVAPAVSPIGPPSLPAPASSWRASHTVATITASSGVIALGVGTAFALDAVSTRSAADPLCQASGCTSEGKTLLENAGAKADIATVSLVVGAVLLVTGGVLWFTSPSLQPSRTSRDIQSVMRF